MQITSFSVSGFRSLEDVKDIPVRKPTILVGPNDGGKSASLTALSFLLGKYEPQEDDLTVVPIPQGATDSNSRRATKITVTGEFRLADDEMAEFSVPMNLAMRRIFHPADGISLEMLAPVSSEPKLRSLDELGIQALKSLVQEFNLSPDGRRTQRQAGRIRFRTSVKSTKPLKSGYLFRQGWHSVFPCLSSFAGMMPLTPRRPSRMR